MESIINNINIYKDKFTKTKLFNHQYALVSLITLLEFYLDINDKEFLDYVNRDNNFQDKKNNYNKKLVNSYKRFIENNNVLLNDTILPYKTYIYSFTPYREEYIEPDICLRIICDFLLSIDPNLYNMFCELYSCNRILFKEGFSGGLEFNEKKRDSIYIIVGTLSSVSDMSTLIHELGHAYKDYIIPDYHRYFNVNHVLSSEISSKTLELMFLLYLIKNNLFRDDAIKSFNNYQNIINTSVNQTLINHNYNISNMKDLSYLLGGIIANNYMINNDMSYHDFIKNIYFSNIKTILKELNKSNIKKFHF